MSISQMLFAALLRGGVLPILERLRYSVDNGIHTNPKR